MQVDSHHHFWKYEAAEYGWISPEMSVLKRDFLPTYLLEEIRGTGIDGVISVQARQTEEETNWLLAMAAEHEFIRGVVGWVPLASKDIRSVLEPLAQSSWLKGVRHVVQDEPDDGFILNADFNRGISELGRFGLIYDILIYAKHLANSIRFVDQHPAQSFVVDHIAKPTIRSDEFHQTWADEMRELARREHVVCKFSGVVTEVRDASWSTDSIRPYWEVALEAFGPNRLMFGSDWPVCLLRSEYSKWVSTVRELISELSPTEQAEIMGATACRTYEL
ncbi:MAG: amidohydrolase family protein [Planctomycetaceae bacterium]|nr:amidohydrolase family protein [Planctomycetales bacterium]MCB9923242.1 amidohydrolase family protein [Planctomycetaceae bacterium]